MKITGAPYNPNPTEIRDRFGFCTILVVYLGHAIFHSVRSISVSFIFLRPRKSVFGRGLYIKLTNSGTSEKKWRTSVAARVPRTVVFDTFFFATHREMLILRPFAVTHDERGIHPLDSMMGQRMRVGADDCCTRVIHKEGHK